MGAVQVDIVKVTLHSLLFYGMLISILFLNHGVVFILYSYQFCFVCCGISGLHLSGCLNNL